MSIDDMKELLAVLGAVHFQGEREDVIEAHLWLSRLRALIERDRIKELNQLLKQGEKHDVVR